jgi:uncharacterized protein
MRCGIVVQQFTEIFKMADLKSVEKKRNRPLPMLFLAMITLVLSGCGTMRSYDRELSQTMGLTASGRPDLALVELEKNNTSEEKDLLYYEEKGQLLNIIGRFDESRSTWLSADEKIKIWEAEVTADPNKVIGDIGSVVLNDKTRRYDGQDFEKVMLSTKLALNHLQLGDFDAARIEIKKTHEREAIIAGLREKEFDKLEEKKKEKNIKTEAKDIKGYPVETLNDPEVTSLKNSYQSAFSHYLAGFVYEALGEPGLAAPGYRTAIELRPDIKWLEEGLAKLESRKYGIKPDETDVLFVVEVGAVPARQSISFPVPVPTVKGMRAVPFSIPVIRPDKTLSLPTQITVDNRQPIDIYAATSLSAMALRALKDDMPGIIIRGSIRAMSKIVAEEASKDLPLLQLGVIVGGVIMESADERVWRTLPSHILIGRAVLPAGQHVLNISTPYGQRSATFEVAGMHAIIPMRLLGDKLFLTQPTISPKMIAKSEAAKNAVPPIPAKGGKKARAEKEKKK